MGPISKIRIGHNDTGSNSAWYLERVVIQRHVVKNAKTSNSDSNKSETPEFEEYWLSKSDGDKQTVREVMATDANGNPLFDSGRKFFFCKKIQ